MRRKREEATSGHDRQKVSHVHAEHTSMHEGHGASAYRAAKVLGPKRKINRLKK